MADHLGQGISASPAAVHNTTLGRQLVYLADSLGTVTAVDGGTGERVWSFPAAADVNSSPAVFRDVVYIGSSDHKLYALNATTGARLCSFDTGGVISSSPVAVDTAAGVVVYVGDNGIGGSNDGGHVWAINGVDASAAGDCTQRWMFENFGNPPGSQPDAGMWSPPAYATDRNGRALVIAGSSSPDNAAYAFDALTGQVVWRFQTQFFFADGDVGAGPTISSPGVKASPTVSPTSSPRRVSCTRSTSPPAPNCGSSASGPTPRSATAHPVNAGVGGRPPVPRLRLRRVQHQRGDPGPRSGGSRATSPPRSPRPRP